MKNFSSLPKRIFTTFCLLTGTTNLAARGLGASFFLPALFIKRYANMGGLDSEHFAQEMKGIRSFTDDAWCGYWNTIAKKHIAAVENAVPGMVGNALPLGDDEHEKYWPHSAICFRHWGPKELSNSSL